MVINYPGSLVTQRYAENLRVAQSRNRDLIVYSVKLVVKKMKQLYILFCSIY
jgi:hypothetical protein